MKFSFSDLFYIKPLPKAPSHHDIFTHEITDKDLDAGDVSGDGIYCIARKGLAGYRLIYIGKHATNDPFHKARVIQHIKTFTSIFLNAMSLGTASYRVKSEIELKKLFYERFHFKGCLDNKLFQLVWNQLTEFPHRNSNYPPEGSYLATETLHLKKSSSETSKRRFQFACFFWDEIIDADNLDNLDDYFEKHYEFHWFPLVNNEFEESEKKSTAIEALEKSLIYKYRPVLNKEMNAISGQGDVVDMLKSPIGMFDTKSFKRLLSRLKKEVIV
jgi:hypothetical protein